jgi:3-hydroxyisobutyrate dehydrogenase-like beta-hydroxyacid dehydrogenase
MKQIGMIGAGIMASGMAQNFLKHGYPVHVWNRTPEMLEPLTKAGAQAADSPKAVAEVADMVIECVSDDNASRSVWLGDDGILAGARPDNILIASSSLSLDWTTELANLCKEKGYKFLDMPLTGSRPGAENGRLKLLVGGDQMVLEEVRSELSAISDKIYYFGPSPAGMKFKLWLNAVQAIQIDAVSQAIVLAEKIGLDLKTVHHTLFDAPMGPASPAVNMAFNALDSPDNLNFAVKYIEKDLRYAQAMARQFGAEYEFLDEVQQHYAQAKDAGLADRDWTAIINLYRDSSTQ